MAAIAKINIRWYWLVGFLIVAVVIGWAGNVQYQKRMAEKEEEESETPAKTNGKKDD